MIGYCTNIHSGNTLDEIVLNLRTYAQAVQQQVGFPLELGLWLPNDSLEKDTGRRLQDVLHECGLTTRSLNGFPFGNFHQQIVGKSVYQPTWCELDRLDYTNQLATILSELLPTNKSGSISTLPLGWGESWNQDEVAAKLLLQCIDHLEKIEQETGKLVHLDVEPEPGCRLQTAADLAMFVQTQFGDDDRVRRYLRVCYDTCHAAVMRENPSDSLAQYAQVGLEIGKVQLSSAIEIDFSKLNQGETVHAKDNLRMLHEPRYLHQTTILEDEQLEFYENLSDALEHTATGSWRVHFHVPIHQKRFGPLQTSQLDVLRTIPLLPKSNETVWEVETYTWDVVPETFKDHSIIESISSEIRWANTQVELESTHE
ncbi:MAG: metabolite traffic protein EboE [Phycisphaerales bacterium]|nr:metabolite traffic protein EboE [Phycisphaerales bacterium]